MSKPGLVIFGTKIQSGFAADDKHRVRGKDGFSLLMLTTTPSSGKRPFKTTSKDEVALAMCDREIAQQAKQV